MGKNPDRKRADNDGTHELYPKGGAAGQSMPSPPTQPRPSEERLTEDEMQRAALGGTRGNENLPDAPMTPQRAKKTPGSSDPGHTA